MLWNEAAPALKDNGKIPSGAGFSGSRIPLADKETSLHPRPQLVQTGVDISLWAHVVRVVSLPAGVEFAVNESSWATDTRAAEKK